MNACGTCTLCCTLKRVEGFPAGAVKEAYVRCEHVCPGGCSIYAERPEPCGQYECIWLQSQKRKPSEQMPKSLRPDRSGVILETNTRGTLIATGRSPAAWKAEPMRSKLIGYTRRGATVLLKCEKEVLLLKQDGTTIELVLSGTEADGTNRYVPRKG